MYLTCHVHLQTFRQTISLGFDSVMTSFSGPICFFEVDSSLILNNSATTTTVVTVAILNSPQSNYPRYPLPCLFAGDGKTVNWAY